MPPPRDPVRGASFRGATRRRLRALICGAILLSVSLGTLGIPVDNHSAWGQEVAEEVFPVPPGWMTRPLEQAKAALAVEDYPTAIEHLGKILRPGDAEEANLFEDHFLPTKPGQPTRSVLTEARDLVGNLPSRGRAVFELKFGIPARQQLLAAVAANDSEQLRRVSTDYFHTKAGYVATYLLGREKMWQGEYRFAARYFAKLLAWEAARRAFDPELTIQYAIAMAALGERDEAAEVLFSLKEKQPTVTVQFAGQVSSLRLESVAAAGDFIDELLRDSSLNSQSVPIGEPWLGYRSAGNRCLGQNDLPLPIPDWSVSHWRSPLAESIRQLQGQRREARRPIVPAAQPLSVKNSIVYRTPHHTLGIDRTTGKRIWQYPWSHQPTAPEATSVDWRDAQEIEEELWSSSITGQLSSDGERVFFVEPAHRPTWDGTSLSRLMPTGDRGRDINSLVSLRIIDEQGTAVEGQLAWRIDPNEDPAWSDTVFLGPPCLDGPIAYLLYERNGQIRAGALNSADGKLIWSQQIASTQSRDGFAQRRYRYRQALTPLVTEGLLICPTMAGCLVAIDLSDRTLEWGFRYEQLDEARYPLGLGDSGSFTPWLDQALFVVDDHLCFTPVDSRDCFVIGLQDGIAKATHPQRDHLLVIGAWQDRLVMLGQDAVTLVSAVGVGESRISFQPHGQLAGTGFFGDRFLFLPLSGGKLIQIDLEEKKIAEVITTARPLGNLIQSGGRIVSQRIDGIDAYWLRTAAVEEARQNETRQDDSAAQWLLTAQLDDLDQKPDSAILAAARSVQRAPSELNSAFLSRLMVQRLSQGNNADWAVLESSYSLLENPEHRRTFLLAKIESRFADGNPQRILPDMIELVDLYATQLNGPSDLIPVSPRHSVRGIRRLRSLLLEATRQLDAIPRAEWIQQLRARYLDIVGAADPGQSRLLTELFGEFDFVREAFPALIQSAIETRSSRDLVWLESLLLDGLARHDDPEIRRQLYRELYRIHSHGLSQSHPVQRELARGELEGLLHSLEQEAEVLGIASADWYEELKKELVATSRESESPAADGLAQIEVRNDNEDFFFMVDAQDQRYRSFCQFQTRLKPLPLRIEFDDRGVFSIRDLDGKLIYQNDSRSPGSRHRFDRFDQSAFQVLGNLLVIHCGQEHIGLDLAQVARRTSGNISGLDPAVLVGEADERDDPGLIWRFNAHQSAIDPGQPLLTRKSNGLGLIVDDLQDANGYRLGRTTTLNSRGYCLLTGGTLLCLDPWTGQVIWERTGLQPGSDLTGDRDFIHVIAPDDRSLTVYRTLDGKQMGEQQVPATMINRIAMRGSTVVALRETETEILVQGHQLDEQQTVVRWSHSYSPGTRADWIDGQTLALLTPKGDFQVIEIDTGARTLSCPLDLDPGFATLQVERMAEQLLVVANRYDRSEIAALRTELESVTRPVLPVSGQIQLVDESGPVWQSAAEVTGYDLVLNQPDLAEAILWKRRSPDRKSTELVFLRRSDGSSIEFHAPLPHAGVTTNIVQQRLPEITRLTFNVGYQFLTLELTARPRPPEAAARLTGQGPGADESTDPALEVPTEKDPFEESLDPFHSVRKQVLDWIREERSRRSRP